MYVFSASKSLFAWVAFLWSSFLSLYRYIYTCVNMYLGVFLYIYSFSVWCSSLCVLCSMYWCIMMQWYLSMRLFTSVLLLLLVFVCGCMRMCIIYCSYVDINRHTGMCGCLRYSPFCHHHQQARCRPSVCISIECHSKVSDGRQPSNGTRISPRPSAFRVQKLL